CDDRLAGIMLTNPNTLGLFEERVGDIVELVHAAGGFVYGDGANMNALTGIVRPGELGIDLMHFNLHKTFATPHGGGGPGSGPLGAGARLADYLPGPVVEHDPAADPRYRFAGQERSIGRMTAFHGNFGMLVRAFAYIRAHGAPGLRTNAADAVLNANYLRSRLKAGYPVPFDRLCMHEFVAEGRPEGSNARATDVSKRLMDFGLHPPTNYFPLIVHEALMIEPTETETKETLDAFAEAMLQIAAEASDAPEKLRYAPHATPVSRLDEVKAARESIVTDRAARCSDGGN
ncbi:MAG: aminomethyl-transferring glycine dehydrogenase subunit GcvPB, partial [Gammaproteobacteria bacterium]|nr:aminomethyl-transferring glycine dehydrogenase subunit GcvPB [Gammaproteobacteria bacterium]